MPGEGFPSGGFEKGNMENVIVIGGGIAGMTVASALKDRGCGVSVVEKKAELGGNVASWDRLFPEGRPAAEILQRIRAGVSDVDVHTGVSVERAEALPAGGYRLGLSDGREVEGAAVVMAGGFSLFDAHLKEEYGYGIYDNVFTSADLEAMFARGQVLTRAGKAPGRIGFVHCVGSRDEKIGNRYCSKVCCVTAVKQASEIKQLYPEAEVYCFYMDLRMYDLHFEDMYFNAQTLYGVRFVRGRLCEAAEDQQKRVVLKVEDTLADRTLRLPVDMLVLMAGMTAPSDTARVADLLGVKCGKDGFLQPQDVYTGRNRSSRADVFLAGACTGPKSIPETLADALAAAQAVGEYIEKRR